jgi:transmembrane sensor
LKENATTQLETAIKKRYLYAILKYAAIIIFALGVGKVSYIYILKPAKQDKFTVISAPKGSLTNVLLADGSSVRLNSGSILKYDNTFNGKDRVVYLEGEAFFDVSRNKKKPFYVKTSHISLKVVGTSFNVKSYNDEDVVQATLVTGSIVIEENVPGNQCKTIVLKPNQRATIYTGNKQTSASGGQLVTEPGSHHKSDSKSMQPAQYQKEEVVITDKVDVEKDISWKDGYIIASHETLEELITKLERRYDVQFAFENNEIKKYKFSGKIFDLTLEQVLNAIKISSPITYRIDKKIVTIGKK